VTIPGLADALVRKAAFEWLESQSQLHGDVFPRSILAEGFRYQDKRIPLLGPQGIFKPAAIDLPISITTIPNGPYDDGYYSDELIEYKYRGSDPQHRDNRGLRQLMQQKVPLIYFYQVVKSKYLAIWPVYIVGDNPHALTFTVQVDDSKRLLYPTANLSAENRVMDEREDLRRSYITSTVRQRVHQRAFRERVLEAYREQCALCRLRHVELLDAAHIIPDGEPDGDPVVANGLSLCKLHHAAFDRHFIGITPDCVVEVRRDILEEEDGPMLLHGLKEMHGQKINIPKKKTLQPNELLLQRRYEQFLRLV